VGSSRRPPGWSASGSSARVRGLHLSGASAGLAGVLLLASSGAGNPQIGQGFTLTAVAAAFLGAASFKVGQLNVLGSVVAILFPRRQHHRADLPGRPGLDQSAVHRPRRWSSPSPSPPHCTVSASTAPPRPQEPASRP